MKKEEIYINLQGKNKEELTNIYNLLVSLKQPMYSSLERNLIDLRDWEFYKFYEFYEGKWCLSNDDSKKEVTIEQLKEILQPMENKEEQLKEILRKEAKERGYTHDNFKCLTCRKSKSIGDIDKWHYCNLSDRLYTNVLGEGGNVVYENGVWAEIVSESLEQQLQKAEAEVKRLQYLIEEDSKIKVGDFIYFNNGSTKGIDKVINIDSSSHYKYSTQFCLYKQSEVKKITNPELIKLLEQDIK